MHREENQVWGRMWGRKASTITNKLTMLTVSPGFWWSQGAPHWCRKLLHDAALAPYGISNLRHSNTCRMVWQLVAPKRSPHVWGKVWGRRGIVRNDFDTDQGSW